jgi:radical SAM-linked protein
MQSEPPASAPHAALQPRCKYRIRFSKGGDLRLVSHHDLMHCFERMFRRAALPTSSTQGFNPRPRMAFAQSLALGIIGVNEVLELELTEPLPAEDICRRLAAQCPPGLTIRSVKPIDIRAAARVRRTYFRLPLTLGRHSCVPSEAGKNACPTVSSLDLPARCTAFLGQEHHWIERTRPARRRIDIRPFVAALAPDADGLSMALWVTPHGAARPEEVAEALGLQALLEAGAILERTDLELADETTDTTPLPATLPAAPPMEDHRTAEGDDRTEERPQATRPTALITGPLSFDS